MGFLQSIAQVVLAISIVFFLLLAFSLIAGEPGTGSYIVAQLTLIPVVLSFIASTIVIYTGWEPF